MPTTGFLGTPLAPDPLVDAGRDKLAFDLLLRTEFPGVDTFLRAGHHRLTVKL